MAEASTTRRGRGRATAVKEEPALTVVEDTVDDTVGDVPVKKTGRTKINRDLSISGVGALGGFEDADPEELPGTGKHKDVSYLYDPLMASYEEDSWKRWVVTDKTAAERALRLAARRKDIGVDIRYEDVNVLNDKGEDTEAVAVYFHGRTRIDKTRTK